MMIRNQSMTRRFALGVLAAGIAVASGCATNPVTKKRELRLVSEAQEVQLGRQNYAPMQQTQGGSQNAFPAVNAYVNEVGQRLAKVSDRPHLPYEFVVINNGVPNAWALPGGKIALNRGLLTELNNEAELAAVLGHEIVHAAARHGAKSMERGILMQGLLMAGGMALDDQDYRDVIIGAAGMTAGLVGQKYSRAAELESDRFGIRYMSAAGYDPEAAVELQKTFVRLSEGKQSGWLQGMFASHPPSQERVNANRALVDAMETKGSDLKKAEFDAAIEELRAAEPAYDKMKEGYKALTGGQPGQAKRLAKEAIAIEPREAHFYGLAAKASKAQNDASGALSFLDQALALNNNYFDFYLQRGLLRSQLGQTRLAQQDLAASTRLLPTAQAHNALGFMAYNGGNAAQAVQHFRVAAGAKTPAGQQSLLMLTRLELPSHPEKFIQIRIHRDRQGYLTLTATNRSPLPVRDIRVMVNVYGPNGNLVTRSPVSFPQVILPERTQTSVTRIGKFVSDEHLAASVRVGITAARIAE